MIDPGHVALADRLAQLDEQGVNWRFGFQAHRLHTGGEQLAHRQAADEKTPAKLVTEGKGISGSQFTYATGKLVLWSADPMRVDPKGAALVKGDFRHLSIASPRLAPYRAAAIEVLTSLKLLDAIQPKFVQGENLAQAYQFIASGNAELGFVALAQVLKDGKLIGGSAWVVPAELYSPIRQDAVLLDKGQHNRAAITLMKYLAGDKAKHVIRAFGYDVR